VPDILCRAKFIFPNDENVYMHGTPAPQLFSRPRCVGRKVQQHFDQHSIGHLLRHIAQAFVEA
jgi:hypothetical protein